MIDELETRQHSAHSVGITAWALTHSVGGIDGSVELGYAPPRVRAACKSKSAAKANPPEKAAHSSLNTHWFQRGLMTFRHRGSIE